METIAFKERPNERNECNQWTLARDANDHQDYVVQEHLMLDAVLSGKPNHLFRRLTVAEFLATDQPLAVKRKLQSILDQWKMLGSQDTVAE
jgi:hypothetical protein